MRKNEWHDFFKVDGEFSMRNLTVFVTIFFASIVVVYMAVLNTLTDMIFTTYMLAGGGVYSFGKWQDSKTEREVKNVVNRTKSVKK